MAEPPRQKRRRSLVQDARKLQRLASTGDPENPSFHANALLSTPKSSAHKAYAACETCRHKKVKCDEGRPFCSYCGRHGFRCIYTEYTSQKGNADVMAVLLDRLDQVERTIEGLHRKLDYQRAEPGERSAELRKMPIPGNLDNGVTFPPRQMLGKKFSSANSIRPDIEFDEILDSGQGYPTPMPHSRGALMAREEIRPPLPDLLATTTPTDVMDLMPFVDDFLEHPRALFPLTCKSTAYNVAGIVRSEGLLTNIRSCYALLMVALSKAFSDCSSTESGLSDFQLANSMLGRLNAQLSLEYVQVLILSSLFLLKKGRLINFSMALHTACTSLYTLILRDNAAGVQRNKTERNNIMASYWICYNLEHELILEIDETLSQSSLCLLEENFPLPLGCDIPHNANLPPRIRDEIMLFMAEMSLKRILNRALTTSKPTAYSLDTSTPSHSQGSPLILELQNQVHDWLVRLPSCLGWSTEPDQGVVTPVTTRLRLTYWFTHLAVLEPMINEIIHNLTQKFQLSTWKLFQDGVLAAFTLLKVFVWENPDIDFIMGNRVLRAFNVVKASIRLGCPPVQDEGLAREIPQAAIKLLWKKMAGKSEWIACKIRASIPHDINLV